MNIQFWLIRLTNNCCIVLLKYARRRYVVLVIVWWTTVSRPALAFLIAFFVVVSNIYLKRSIIDNNTIKKERLYFYIFAIRLHHVIDLAGLVLAISVPQAAPSLCIFFSGNKCSTSVLVPSKIYFYRVFAILFSLFFYFWFHLRALVGSTIRRSMRCHRDFLASVCVCVFSFNKK